MAWTAPATGAGSSSSRRRSTGAWTRSRPTIAWNSLRTSLYKRNSVKDGWGLALAGVGVPTSLLPGVFSPAGVQTGHQNPQFYNLVTNGTTTGRFARAEVDWLVEHGPKHLLRRIKAPTLIVQGTVDSLFTLAEAHRNYRALRRAGTPVRMMWFCGGHGLCVTESDAPDPISGIAGDGPLIVERKLGWFKRWLKGRKRTNTGPRFEWMGEDGVWRKTRYPRKWTLRRPYEGEGSGTLPLTPGVSGAGLLILATPSLISVDVPIEAPPAGINVIGAPKLDLTYRATGVSLAADGDTHAFAQIVDKGRNIVVGNFATPIPIKLDGERHRIRMRLERIASRSIGAGYTLQIIPQTNVYDLQRATGLVTVESAKVSLPSLGRRAKRTG